VAEPGNAPDWKPFSVRDMQKALAEKIPDIWCPLGLWVQMHPLAKVNTPKRAPESTLPREVLGIPSSALYFYPIMWLFLFA